MSRLTDEELIETLETQLPKLLERHPELEMRVYATFMRTFATKQEVAAVLAELRAFRGVHPHPPGVGDGRRTRRAGADGGGQPR